MIQFDTLDAALQQSQERKLPSLQNKQNLNREFSSVLIRRQISIHQHSSVGNGTAKHLNSTRDKDWQSMIL
jgi:hypothetical protein